MIAKYKGNYYLYACKKKAEGLLAVDDKDNYLITRKKEKSSKEFQFEDNRFFVKKEELFKKSFKRMLPDYYDGVLAFVIDNEYKKSFYTKNTEKPDRCICVVNWETNELLNEIKRYIAIQYLVSKKEEFSEKDPTAETELLLYLEVNHNL